MRKSSIPRYPSWHDVVVPPKPGSPAAVDPKKAAARAEAKQARRGKFDPAPDGMLPMPRREYRAWRRGHGTHGVNHHLVRRSPRVGYVPPAPSSKARARVRVLRAAARGIGLYVDGAA